MNDMSKNTVGDVEIKLGYTVDELSAWHRSIAEYQQKITRKWFNEGIEAVDPSWCFDDRHFAFCPYEDDSTPSYWWHLGYVFKLNELKLSILTKDHA